MSTYQTAADSSRTAESPKRRHSRPRSGRGQAPAGIQTKDVNPVFLVPRLRRGDEKTELVDGRAASLRHSQTSRL